MRSRANGRGQRAKWAGSGRRSKFVFPVLALLLTPCALWAATNPPTEEIIPPLRPPRPLLAPGTWEEHGLAIVVVSVLLVLLLGLVVWFLTRPRPVPEVPPAARARNDLRSLATAADQPQTLSRISQILRRYFAETFALSTDEMTTAEFRASTRDHAGIGSELGLAVNDFLAHCDTLKFAPEMPKSSPDTVDRALKLIDQAEARAIASRAGAVATPAGNPRRNALT